MANSDECTYDISVKTGAAGTTSRIGLNLGSFENHSMILDNLKDWGTMPAGHTYFQPGNLDLFKVPNKHFLDVCKITLTSDGKGTHPDWDVDFVDITTVNSVDSNKHFSVNQSMASNKLSITVDLCNRTPNPITLSSE